MPRLQQQARALGDPTRHRIFGLLAESGQALGVAELTGPLGLHHNAVRQHLAKLVDAGLVIERRSTPSGPGRPPTLFEVSPDAESRWGVAGPYERLASWLAEMLATGESPREVGRRAGRARAEPSGPEPDALLAFMEELAREGFEPESGPAEGELAAVEVRLHHCPYASAVQVSPESVCGFHLGFAEGLAESIGRVHVERLTPRDPREGDCTLVCRVPRVGQDQV